MKIIKSLLLVSIMLFPCFLPLVQAEERFVVIADAEIPDLMQTVQSVGAFAEKIQPGMQMVIVGSVIALNFDPTFAPFDMNSKLRLSLYGDAKDKTTLPILCGIAKYKKSSQLPENIKLGKKYKLFVKALDQQALIASSENLLQDIKTIPKETQSKSDLVIQLFPERYLKKCPGNIAYLRDQIQKELPENDRKQADLDNKSIEKLLQQCEKMEMKVNAEEKNVNLKLQVHPVHGMELAAFLQATKPGEISDVEIIKLGKKISGNQAFNVTDGLNGIISRLLGKFFNDGDSRPFDQLCDIKASHDKTTLSLRASISQLALHKALMDAGVIKPQQKQNQK